MTKRPELYTNDFNFIYGKTIDLLNDGMALDATLDSLRETYFLFDDEVESLLEYLKNDYQVNYILFNNMSEYLYNMYDETVEVFEFPAGTITKFDDGTIKHFSDYETAIKKLFKMGYHF